MFLFWLHSGKHRCWNCNLIQWVQARFTIATNSIYPSGVLFFAHAYEFFPFVCFMKLSFTGTGWRKIQGWFMNDDLKRLRGKRSWPDTSATLVFAWKRHSCHIRATQAKKGRRNIVPLSTKLLEASGQRHAPGISPTRTEPRCPLKYYLSEGTENHRLCDDLLGINPDIYRRRFYSYTEKFAACKVLFCPTNGRKTW